MSTGDKFTLAGAGLLVLALFLGGMAYEAVKFFAFVKYLTT